MAYSINGLKRKVDKAFKDAFKNLPRKNKFNPIPKKLTSGKLYEAYVLAIISDHLKNKEGFDLKLVNGKNIYLRSSHGPIDRKFPFIELYKNNKLMAEIWTDIEFLGLSYSLRNPTKIEKGDYHELDILVLSPNLNGRPSNKDIWLGVECKNTEYDKSLLKEILGVRREMSLLSHNNKTMFAHWPMNIIPADPPSCLVVFSTNRKVNDYSSPGSIFGIGFYHLAF